MLIVIDRPEARAVHEVKTRLRAAGITAQCMPRTIRALVAVADPLGAQVSCAPWRAHIGARAAARQDIAQSTILNVAP